MRFRFKRAALLLLLGLCYLDSGKKACFAGFPSTARLRVPRAAEATDWSNSKPDSFKGKTVVTTAVVAVAVVQGNDEEVRSLVEQGADLEAIGGFGRTALAFAAWAGNLEITRFLAEKGALLEALDDTGRTPLALAASYGHADVVEYLIRQGAILESTDNGGLTPLLWAALNGHTACVSRLLEGGCNLDATDEDGMTALKLAAVFNKLDVVKLLVENGADAKSALTLVRSMSSSADAAEYLARHA